MNEGAVERCNCGFASVAANEAIHSAWCATRYVAGERPDVIPEAAVDAMIEDFLPRYVHKWATLPNQWEHRKWWRREFGRLLAVAVPFLRAAHPEAGSPEADRAPEDER